MSPRSLRFAVLLAGVLFAESAYASFAAHCLIEGTVTSVPRIRQSPPRYTKHVGLKLLVQASTLLTGGWDKKSCDEQVGKTFTLELELTSDDPVPRQGSRIFVEYNYFESRCSDGRGACGSEEFKLLDPARLPESKPIAAHPSLHRDAGPDQVK